MNICTYIISVEKKISKEKKCLEFPDFSFTHSPTRSQSIPGTQAFLFLLSPVRRFYLERGDYTARLRLHS